MITYIDALVREPIEHLERLVLVPRLETLRMETCGNDRFDQRIEEHDERIGERRNEGTMVPIRTLARELVARVETLHDRKNKK